MILLSILSSPGAELNFKFFIILLSSHKEIFELLLKLPSSNFEPSFHLGLSLSSGYNIIYETHLFLFFLFLCTAAP